MRIFLSISMTVFLLFEFYNSLIIFTFNDTIYSTDLNSIFLPLRNSVPNRFKFFHIIVKLFDKHKLWQCMEFYYVY